MSPSRPREAECIDGPLAGTKLPIAGGVGVYCVWRPPSKQVLDFVYSEGVEPPLPGCVIVGRYTVATGAANRGKLVWEAAAE